MKTVALFRSRWIFSTLLRVLAGLALGTLPIAAETATFPAASRPPVLLTVISPLSPSEFPFFLGRFLSIPIETIGGWPLDLRLTADNSQLLGIATVVRPFAFPTARVQTGFLVFKDPNNCLSFVLASPCPTPDETLLEFTPSVEAPGQPSVAGSSERLNHLTAAGGGGNPVLFAFDGAPGGSNTRPVEIGPNVGNGREHRCAPQPDFFDGAICAIDGDCPPGQTCQSFPDGYGFGADNALPGLVLLSDRGVGNVLDQVSGSPPSLHSPRQARNLAGLLNSVSWELDDATHHTGINAHMVVPNGLFTPTVFVDFCVGVANPDAACLNSAPPLIQADGGALQNHCVVCPTYFDFLSTFVTTIRVFLVNRTAPDVLSDVNGDGVVDSKDAALAGYTVLSNEVVVKVQHLRQDGEFPGILFDFDGNGSSGNPVFPGSGGGLKPPPR